MIIKAPGLNVSIGDDIVQKFFQVKQEDLPFMFNILRKSLYNFPVRAVIREYCSNAQDAHNEVGETLPFIVRAPSSLEPSLSIRDFGPGLSTPDIHEVFVSYGASTKRNKGGQIGGYGIGCKAAFSYSDSFEVTSWWGGVKSSFLCFIDETGVGKIATLDSHPSDEHTGIEVVVRLNNIEDRKDFCNEIISFFCSSKVNALVVGDASVSASIKLYHECPIYAEGEDWLVKRRTDIDRIQRDVLRFEMLSLNVKTMGILNGIAYPLEFEDYKAEGVLRNWSRFAVIIDLSKWGITPSPNRESIVIRDEHIPRIKEIAAKASKEVIARLISPAVVPTDHWHTAIYKRELHHDLRDLAMEEEEANLLPNHLQLNKVNKTKYSKAKIYPDDNPGKLSGVFGARIYRIWDSFGGKLPKTGELSTIHYDPNIQVRVVYGRRHSEAKRHFIEWCIARPEIARDRVILISFPDIERAKKFLAMPQLEGLPWEWFYAPKNTERRPLPKAKDGEVLALVDDLRPCVRHRDSRYWTPAPVPTEKFAYILMSGFRIDERNEALSRMTPHRLKGVIFNYCELMGPIQVVGCAKPLPGGKLFIDLINEAIEANQDVLMEAQRDHIATNVPYFLREMSAERLPEGETALRELLALNPQLDVDEEVALFKENKGKHLIFILRALDKVEDYMPDFAPALERVYAKYPMLRYINFSTSDEECMEYLQLCIANSRSISYNTLDDAMEYIS